MTEVPLLAGPMDGGLIEVPTPLPASVTVDPAPEDPRTRVGPQTSAVYGLVSAGHSATRPICAVAYVHADAVLGPALWDWTAACGTIVECAVLPDTTETDT